MEHIEIVEKSGWRTFFKAAGITLAAVLLVAAGFFGAMLVSNYWM